MRPASSFFDCKLLTSLPGQTILLVSRWLEFEIEFSSWGETVMMPSSRRMSCARASLNIPDANFRRSTRIVLAFLSLLTFSSVGRSADCLSVVVRDPSGLAVAGARVTANGRKRLTEERGEAEICDGGEAQRTIRVRAQGFKPAERSVGASISRIVIDLEL